MAGVASLSIASAQSGGRGWTRQVYRRRNIFCIGYRVPLLYPHFNVGRALTPSSTCKFITPQALKPKANIETGIQGYASLILYFPPTVCWPCLWARHTAGA